MTDWKHDDLQRDLAAHLRGYAKPAMIWTNMQLGPVGSPRPDVYTIEPTYTALRAMAYEIKVSRADFLRDAQAGKALGYLNYAGAVVFAAPKGMLAKAEIPAGCGLLERGPETWRWSKKPTIQPVRDMPREAWMKLLIDGRGRDEGAGLVLIQRKATQWDHERRIRKMLGDELADLVRNRESARHWLEEEIRKLDMERARTADEIRNTLDRRASEARKELAEIEAAIAETAKALGLKDGTGSVWAIKNALTNLRPESDRKQLQDAARTLRQSAQWQLREAEEIEQRLGAAAEDVPA